MQTEGSGKGWVKLLIIGGAIVIGLPLVVGGLYFLFGGKEEPARKKPDEPAAPPEKPSLPEKTAVAPLVPHSGASVTEAPPVEKPPVAQAPPVEAKAPVAQAAPVAELPEEPAMLEEVVPVEESFERIEESVEESYEMPASLEMLPGSDESPRVVPAEIQGFRSAMVQAMRILEEKDAPKWLSSMVGNLKSLGVDSEKTPDRRRSIRVHSQLALSFQLGDKTGEAQVVNIGLGGLHLYLDLEPERGDTIVLLDPASGRARPVGIKCSVQWVRKMPRSTRLLVGVNYDEKPETLARSRLAQLLSELGFLEKLIYRRRRRRRVKARIEVAVNQQFEGTILNIGVGGVLLECGEELSEGANVSLTVGPHGRLYALNTAGEIRYRHKTDDGWHYGIRFVHLNPDQVKLLGKYVLEQLKEEA